MLTFVLLVITSMVIGNKYSPGIVEKPYSYLGLFGFVLFAAVTTALNAKEVRRIHEVKQREGYIYDSHDVTFKDNASIYKLIIYCFMAGILGGIVGTAGGIILGLLFLQMGMLPVVMASTN